jgi:hypothetical protein
MRYTVHYTFDGVMHFHTEVEAETPEEAAESILDIGERNPAVTVKILDIVPAIS